MVLIPGILVVDTGDGSLDATSPLDFPGVDALVESLLSGTAVAFGLEVVVAGYAFEAFGHGR